MPVCRNPSCEMVVVRKQFFRANMPQVQSQLSSSRLGGFAIKSWMAIMNGSVWALLLVASYLVSCGAGRYRWARYCTLVLTHVWSTGVAVLLLLSLVTQEHYKIYEYLVFDFNKLLMHDREVAVRACYTRSIHAAMAMRQRFPRVVCKAHNDNIQWAFSTTLSIAHHAILTFMFCRAFVWEMNADAYWGTQRGQIPQFA